ncbi:MAG: hypothetical protein RIB54_13450 [Fulvivirga sp.]
MDLSSHKMLYTLACAAALLILMCLGGINVTDYGIIPFFHSLYGGSKIGSLKSPRATAAILTLMIIVINKVGVFLIIGTDHVFFFGFLTGLSAIIPYVGTTI